MEPRRRERFAHAHPRTAPSRPRLRTPVAVIAALVVVVVAGVAFAIRSPSGPPAIAAAGPTLPGGADAGGKAGPSLGRHGDLVDGESAASSPPDDTAPGQGVRPLAASELTGYRWPIQNARITNGFGSGHPGSFVLDGRTYHDGLDVASFCGARIVAAHDGVVLTAGRHHEGSMGWIGDLEPFRAKVDAKDGWGGQAITVVIDDRNGYRSIYAHLARKTVATGDVVTAGDLIGYEGSTGNSTGCHLHYALFSPLEVSSLALEKKIAEKTLLPPREIARIDPLLVLPPLADAQITWGWGARAE
jgi:murein DD-endopeptidase MepM/ murein hydrolase activator NlpD